MKPPNRPTESNRIAERTDLPDDPGRREQRDSEYHRRILAATRRLLERGGVETITMYQIAQEAGIGQGTLYRRYEHPGQICSELLRTSTEQFLDSLEAGLSATGEASSALDQLYGLICKLIDYVDDKAELLTAISCMYAGKKSFLPHKRPITIRLHNIFQPLLERACRDDEAEEIDIPLTVNCLLVSLAPEQYLYHRDTLGYSKERFLTGVRRLFVDNLRK